MIWFPPKVWKIKLKLLRKSNTKTKTVAESDAKASDNLTAILEYSNNKFEQFSESGS